MIAFVLNAARSFLDAFVLWCLWTWFVVPLGVPKITYWHAYGIDLFVSIFMIFAFSERSIRDAEDANEEGNITACLAKTVMLLVTLVAGFMIHIWAMP